MRRWAARLRLGPRRRLLVWKAALAVRKPIDLGASFPAQRRMSGEDLGTRPERVVATAWLANT
jgi:hypothetical protein